MATKKKLATVDIRGKAYVPVNERLKYFREHFPAYALDAEIVQITDDVAIIRAVIRNESGAVVASGIAREERNAKGSVVNKTSYVENCETSAWGRALANFGIGVDDSVASADEVVLAVNAGTKTVDTKPEYEVDETPITEETKNTLLGISDKLAAFSNRDIFREWIHATTKTDIGGLTEHRAQRIIAFLTESPDISSWPAAQIKALTKVLAEVPA